jgi:hypothetical protein
MNDDWHKTKSHICPNPATSNGHRGTERFLQQKIAYVEIMFRYLTLKVPFHNTAKTRYGVIVCFAISKWERPGGTSYNASVVKIYNATYSVARF